MPTPIISDVHANIDALETTVVFLEVEGLSKTVCLGDLVGYGPSPQECIDYIHLATVEKFFLSFRY